jgi:hypothetical protein
VENLTHWKKMTNPNYLGTYSLEPGKDKILTLRIVRQEMVQGEDGKKEQCMVAHFIENEKPMILNKTNAKIIEKLYGSPYIEHWANRKIQIYAAKVKAFGETVDALRIRPFIPQQGTISTKCLDCDKDIKELKTEKGVWSPEQMAQYTYQKYGKQLCAECAQKQKEAEEAGKVQDPLA